MEKESVELDPTKRMKRGCTPRLLKVDFEKSIKATETLIMHSGETGLNVKVIY